MTTHDLKTDPDVFEAVWNGEKNFEIRKNDRGFKSGDTLQLRETKYSGVEMLNGKPLEYTGNVITAKVNYILHGPIYGLNNGWCIMDINNWIIQAELQTANKSMSV